MAPIVVSERCGNWLRESAYANSTVSENLEKQVDSVGGTHRTGRSDYAAAAKRQITTPAAKPDNTARLIRAFARKNR